MSTTDRPRVRAAAPPIIREGDPAWDRARRAFNLLVDQRPSAVAAPTSVEGVRTAILTAREQGLRVAARSTGHNAGALGSAGGTLIVETSAFTEVTIDPRARRVRVGGGTRWRAVVPALSRLGLAALHGSSPDVGIAGYSLGGGIGWLARRYGLQGDAVTAVELVNADGEPVRADRDHEPDLFWALRGAGGNFGVVTALEFTVHPVRRLHAGAMFFAFARAPEVLSAWSHALPGMPDEMTTWLKLVHLPDAPHIPARLRGGSYAVVLAAFLGSERRGRAALAWARALRPAIDTMAVVPPVALAGLAMDPPAPLPYASAHALLGGLDDAGTDALMRAAGPGSGATLTMLQLRHTGGALARRQPGAGALATLPGSLSLLAIGVVTGDASAAAVARTLADVREATGPYRVGGYGNLVDEPADARAFFDPRTWARLRRVKAVHDPEDLFTGGHHVPPAT